MHFLLELLLENIYVVKYENKTRENIEEHFSRRSVEIIEFE